MLLVSEIIKNKDKISSLMSKRNIDVKSKLASIIETDKLRDLLSQILIIFCQNQIN
jgi:hypothetical protein